MLALIKLTPWRFGTGTNQPVHDHGNAQSFLLDRIVSVGIKVYSWPHPVTSSRVDFNTDSGVGTFECIEPREEIMRMLAAAQEFQSGSRIVAGPARSYHEVACDWERVHRITTIAQQFGFTYRDASEVHDRWWSLRSPKAQAKAAEHGRKVMTFAELVDQQREAVKGRVSPYPKKTVYQDNLDLLDAEMSEALNR